MIHDGHTPDLTVTPYIDHEGSSYPQSEPIDYTIDERSNQMELRAYYHIPMLYMEKFAVGFHSLYHKYLLTSPSYNGARNLPSFPEHSPYTQDSLDEVIRSADRCLSLPPKRHFKSNHYEYYQKQCRLLKETALALQPKETTRLRLLNTESCKRDLPNCREYNEIHQEIKGIIKKFAAEGIALSAQYNIGLL